jgi:hypothetical protein
LATVAVARLPEMSHWSSVALKGRFIEHASQCRLSP